LGHDEMKKLWFSPIGCFLGALAGVVLGTLVRHRALPFLRGDTILSGGKLVSTAEWTAFMSKFFYIGSAVMVLIGIIALLTLSEANRRYIAQLPRWQRFLIWPW
jgi:uncharacterized oligopeptide transporter (OPT) family protein